MKAILISLLFLALASLYKTGYSCGYQSAYNALSIQLNQDLSNVLTEEQYKKIPVRTMIMMKNIELVK